MFCHLSDIVRDVLSFTFSMHMKIFERRKLSGRAVPRKILEISFKNQPSITNLVIQDNCSLSFENFAIYQTLSVTFDLSACI